MNKTHSNHSGHALGAEIAWERWVRKKALQSLATLSLSEEESSLLRRKIAQTPVLPPPSLRGRSVSPLTPLMEAARTCFYSCWDLPEQRKSVSLKQERKIAWENGSPEEVFEQIQMLFKQSVRDAYSCRLFGQCFTRSMNIQMLLVISETIVNRSHEEILADMIIEHLSSCNKKKTADLVSRIRLGAHQSRVWDAMAKASS